MKFSLTYVSIEVSRGVKGWVYFKKIVDLLVIKYKYVVYSQLCKRLDNLVIGWSFLITEIIFSKLLLELHKL